MFGNRKRKLQEQEESIVPHGLIWHATEEPTPEQVATKSEEDLGYTVNYAQEIERVRRQQAAQPVEQVPDIASQASPPRPAVVPWWRVEQPEAPGERPVSKLVPMPLSAYTPTPIDPNSEPPRPSRIQPLQIRPAAVEPLEIQPIIPQPSEVQPIQVLPTAPSEMASPQILQASAPQVEGSLAKSVQVQPSPVAETVLINPPVPKPQVGERLVPKSSEITESLVLVWARLRSAGKSGWVGLLSVSGNTLAQIRQTIRSLELGEGVARAGKLSQNLIRGGVARTNRYARTTGHAVGAFSHATASRAQQLSAKLRTASVGSTGDVVRTANMQPATPSRIRMLLAASALQAKIIAAQKLSAWRIRRERAAIDSRFWASMTLSAIAAVIALVIVSVVPHYAAKSLPSRILNTNSSVDANVAAPVAAAPAPVQKTATHVRKSATTSSAQTTAAKTVPAKGEPAKSATNPKPKHLVDDDYVAPNTYKYYGTGSKSSH